MYAVIKTGGKQYRVSEGDRVEVELLGQEPGSEVSFTPLLIVDGDRVVSAPAALSGASVSARVIGEAKGPKIVGFMYKSKARNRRKWGHRQRYSTVEVTGISA